MTEPLRVLIVDDEPLALDYLETLDDLQLKSLEMLVRVPLR